MTTGLYTLSTDANLKDAHQLSRDKGIRHIPVVDKATNQLVAVVTQKALISRVMKLANLYGKDRLENIEAEVSILEVAAKDFSSVSEDTNLLDMAEYFLANKHGCLPVINQAKVLQGIVTSSDFVKLAIELLKDKKV